MKLIDFQISDGKILGLESDLLNLKIRFKDWKEQEWLITFDEVISIQSMSVEGEELSHLNILESDIFKVSAIEYFPDEDPDRFLCYSFVGVWSDRALLKIVATDSYNISLMSV